MGFSNAWRQWGATANEASEVMVGDSVVRVAAYEATLAVTVDAGPAFVWPWLVQMGYGRGGLYSYDWLDRLFGYLDRPSADQILPEHQQLSAGDEIPIGRGGGLPVQEIEPLRHLVLGGRQRDVEWTWVLQLNPQPGGRTRLISRNRVGVGRGFRSVAILRCIEPAAFLMTRKMLLGIKRRAESLQGRLEEAA